MNGTNENIDVNIKGILEDLKGDAGGTKQLNGYKGKKKNRSFMLTNDAVTHLKELNFILDKELSVIVEEAIEGYYEVHRKEINDRLK